ncbi:MAG: hypothetical protein KAG34_01560, partial [Cocleimonas sp.]|nr:hypothetical protein [Cocleimonas sp.]
MNHMLKITPFMKKTSLTYASLLALMFAVAPLQTLAKGGWGATPLAEKHRPDREWIGGFSSAPDVIADGSIADAIESCDDVVGAGKHCVIKVTSTGIDGDLPLEISRSKTKLVGVADMLPLTTAENDTFIYIGENTKQVIIENLNLKGHAAGDEEIFAIFIEGENINKILIKNNKIHGFNSNVDAHGIAVYGSGDKRRQAIRNVIIEGNEVSDMRTGSSESIVVNGNVVRWEIKDNEIENVNNIAIDAIGGEGTSATRKRRGRIMPGPLDAARYGFIEGNTV